MSNAQSATAMMTHQHTTGRTGADEQCLVCVLVVLSIECGQSAWVPGHPYRTECMGAGSSL